MKKLPKGIKNIPGANYSRALEISGTLIEFPGILPALVEEGNTMKPKSSSFEQQFREAFENMIAVLKECGLSLDHLVKVLFVVNGDPTEKLNLVNRISREYYMKGKVKDLPVRGFIGGFLLFGAEIEIFFTAVTQVPECLTDSSESSPD